jgi:hypothetical protein
VHIAVLVSNLHIFKLLADIWQTYWKILKTHAIYAFGQFGIVNVVNVLNISLIMKMMLKQRRTTIYQ